MGWLVWVPQIDIQVGLSDDIFDASEVDGETEMADWEIHKV